jgi:phosphate transport system substrate-binding protein
VRPNKLIFCSVMAVVVSATALPAGAAAAEALNGSGSTLVAPLVAEWALAFQTLDRVKVTFTPTGSEAGIQAVSSRAVDFAASEAPMSPSQRSACHSCFQIPWSLTPIGIGYNHRGVGSKLRLDGDVLAAIYLGQIKRWNDPRIQGLNHGLRLPAVNITPVYANGSGDTYVFTSYLSGVSSKWRSGVGTGATVSFPTGVAASSNSAIISRLESTNGALAYAGVSYLIAHGLPAAAVQNSAGRYEFPNLLNIESAARAVNQTGCDGRREQVQPRLGHEAPVRSHREVIAREVLTRQRGHQPRARVAGVGAGEPALQEHRDPPPRQHAPVRAQREAEDRAV